MEMGVAKNGFRSILELKDLFYLISRVKNHNNWYLSWENPKKLRFSLFSL